MIATHSIGKGEEVVNDYGPLSNAELLRAYGYVERRQQGATGSSSGGSKGLAAGQKGAPGSSSKGSVGPTAARQPVAPARSGKGKAAKVPAGGGGGDREDPELVLRESLSSCSVPGNSNSHVQV